MSTISLDACRAGVKLVIANAQRLHEDASYNLAGKRYHSAALLACYAFDEYGKSFLVVKEALRAHRAGREEITTQDLNSAGFYLHKLKLLAVSEVLVPMITGSPPGLEATEEAIKSWISAVHGFRNLVPYVGVEEGVFQSPNEIPEKECKEIIELLDQFRGFMNSFIQEYFDNSFSNMNHTG